MPRGAKIDIQETRKRYVSGIFQDKRSFISIDGHRYLKGVDVSERRAKVFERSGFKCKSCGAPVTAESGELDHKKGGLMRRCDCFHNLQVLCKPCHRAKHVHTRFGEHK